MSAPVWVSVKAAITIHDRQIARHGGAPGLRDLGLLKARIARPLNEWEYGETDLFTLAAATAFGIIKAHAFVDGNKRTALVSALTFLLVNGRHVRAPADKVVGAIEGLAEGKVSEPEFAIWLRENSSKSG